MRGSTSSANSRGKKKFRRFWRLISPDFFVEVGGNPAPKEPIRAANASDCWEILADFVFLKKAVTILALIRV